MCDLCRCEGDQAFVCESRCDIVSEASNCTEAEMVESDDPICPCRVCPDQAGTSNISFFVNICPRSLAKFLLKKNSIHYKLIISY